jgi:HTH-type transcriptional regulator/antitoxin HigA
MADQDRVSTVESDLAIHPGEILEEELEARELTQAALARAMGRPAQAINEIVRGRKSISAETAIGLEEVLGIEASLWLNLQAQYDLTVARAQRRKAS